MKSLPSHTTATFRRWLCIGLATVTGVALFAGPSNLSPAKASVVGEVKVFGPTALPGSPSSPGSVVAAAASPSGRGYWLAGKDGGVFSYGDAAFHGSAAPLKLREPVVGIASTRSGNGYWLAAEDAGVFAYGDAPFLGTASHLPLNAPVIGIEARPQADGYWLVSQDGGIFNFGNAPYLGSLAGTKLNQPITAMAVTPSGNGYWLIAADGGVFAFGDAPFLGSMNGTSLNGIATAIAPTDSGRGYWIATADGGIFSFGDAPFHGAALDTSGAPVVDLLSAGGGYVTVSGDQQALTRAGYRFLGDFVVTCYALSGRTASGQPVGMNVVAVDRNLIKLGTPLRIGGIGDRVALDTGGNIKGKRLDVWLPNRAACINFGRQTLPVWVR